MLGYPFNANLSTGELAQFAPGRERRSNPYYAGGQQSQLNPYSSQNSRLAAFGAGVGVVGAGLYGLQRSGRNPFDTIHAAARVAEDFSPGQVLRTFSVGDFFSQFSTTNAATRHISAQTIQGLKSASDSGVSAWWTDLSHRTGGRNYAAMDYGLTFRNGQLFAGSEMILDNARVMTSTGTPNLASGYSRGAGFSKLAHVRDSKKLGGKIAFSNAAGDAAEEIFYFTGGATKKQAVGNQAHAFLTDAIQRANRLADAPFEIEPFASMTSKLKGALGDTTLSSKSGTALQTLGHMSLKWGIGGTAAYLGYKTIDSALRDTSVLDNTILAEGSTAAVASVGVGASKMASSFADAVPGLRGYQALQEEIAPGSTSLTTLLGVPLATGLSGLIGAYGVTINDRISVANELMKTDPSLGLGQALAKADPIVAEEAKHFASETFDKVTFGKFKQGRPSFIGSMGRAKQFGFMGMAIGAAAVLPFLPGALIPENTRAEAERLYSGEDEVAVRKGRFWEMGRSDFEGGRIEYFRPHWFPRMLQGSRDKSMGSDRNPLSQWYAENFTYDVEKEHYYDRPFPITGAAFEDIPIAGPALSVTLGEIVKPQMLMHEDRWRRHADQFFSDTDTVLRLQERAGEGIRPDRGDTPPGTPALPGSTTQVLGDQAYRLTELTGLIGFSLSSMKKQITGSDEWFDQDERLQSARRSYGAEREYWDMSLGGAFGTSEFFRRLFPHRRRQIPEYNPIRNMMPTWLPGPGERAPDLLHGDPFSKLAEGELRLPGEGFAARFSELEGVAPEDYSPGYKYKILSDVAPFAKRTAQAERVALAAMTRGELSDRESDVFLTAQEQAREMKGSRKSFYDFNVLTSGADISLPGSSGSQQSRDLLTSLNQGIANREPSRGIGSTLAGGYWEGLVKGIQNPIEALTPLAPASKLMHLRSAIEDYQITQRWGRDVALWDSPIENFIKPFGREMLGFVGIDTERGSLTAQRDVSAYFDLLKYVKNTRLSEQAGASGLGREARAYAARAEETLIGVNPYSKNRRSLFRALPKAERDYFNAFSAASNQGDREQILGMVPENERRIYKAQWEMQYANEISSQLESGDIPENLRAEAQSELGRLYQTAEAEGFPVNQSFREQYEDQRVGDQTYGDWFRNSILLNDSGGSLPGADWVGWHPAVDLDDIKLKVVQNAGMDIHDFDLWESDARAATHREYLNDAADKAVEIEMPKDNKPPAQVQAEVEQILGDLGILGQVQISALESDDSENNYRIVLDVSEVRDDDLKQALREMTG